MIKTKAKIRLYKTDVGRKTPFRSGYKPLFNFVSEMKVSGQIILYDREEFFPGDEAIVGIFFLNKDYLGTDFGVGARFVFSEGNFPLGEGEIKEVLCC